jgi:hypothetical protein
MKKLLLATIFVLTSIFVFSQVANYSYTATTSTWAANASPTAITGLGLAINDALSSAINIGFSFVYDGTTYTQFKSSSNGFLTFNTGNTLAQPTNNLNTSTERSILAVLWDDNQTGAAGNVNYKVTVSTPNRILTVEWKQLRWNKNGYSAGTIDCQIKLYETSNKIEYIYNRGTYQSLGNSSGIGASIGLSGATSGDFISLSDIAVAPTKSTSVETSTIGASPTNFLTKTAAQANTAIPNGTTYRFGPPPTIITNGSFSAFTSCSGYVSTEQSYTVSGFGLTADIVVTAPTGFELSTTSGGVFSSSVTLVQSSGVVNSTTIYVRMKSNATGTPSGNISATSTSATTKTKSVSGTVNPASVGGSVAADQNVMSGTDAATVNLSGHTGSVIKWQRDIVSTFATATDVANTTTFVNGPSMGGITQTIYYRAVVQNGNCATANSAYVTITVVNGLPIELLYFNGVECETGNRLSWSTASESNNDYFTIEKTKDGKDWISIVNLSGAGNSSNQLYYYFMDENIESIINYYRLLQTDYDGHFKYSEIISIDNRNKTEAKEVYKIVNAIGQEVDLRYYRGLVIIEYSDGSSEKIIK